MLIILSSHDLPSEHVTLAKPVWIDLISQQYS